LEWLDPPFSAGHWVPELVELAGAKELIGKAGEHSQTIRWSDVAAADPDLIIAAACGYSVEQTRQDVRRLAELPEWRTLRAVQNERILFLDGNAYFSRPGPRLVEGLELLAKEIGACGSSRA
jgi:iron complex transport system substrate-binding protein